MGELRLYAIGIEEVRGIFGAAPSMARQLRELANTAFAPPEHSRRGGFLAKLGPIFKKVPDAPVISPTQPGPQDVEVLLAGSYVPPDRVGATWRVLETMVSGTAWGATKMTVDRATIDELDFALARGGVSAAVGLRHLLNNPSSLGLTDVEGLRVGYHPYETALAMAGAYRSAMPQIKTREQQDLISALASWLDGFVAWARVAPSLHRPVPDLVGFLAE